MKFCATDPLSKPETGQARVARAVRLRAGRRGGSCGPPSGACLGSETICPLVKNVSISCESAVSADLIPSYADLIPSYVEFLFARRHGNLPYKLLNLLACPRADRKIPSIFPSNWEILTDPALRVTACRHGRGAIGRGTAFGEAGKQCVCLKMTEQSSPARRGIRKQDARARRRRVSARPPNFAPESS